MKNYSDNIDRLTEFAQDDNMNTDMSEDEYQEQQMKQEAFEDFSMEIDD